MSPSRLQLPKTQLLMGLSSFKFFAGVHRDRMSTYLLQLLQEQEHGQKPGEGQESVHSRHTILCDETPARRKKPTAIEAQGFSRVRYPDRIHGEEHRVSEYYHEHGQCSNAIQTRKRSSTRGCHQPFVIPSQ